MASQPEYENWQQLMDLVKLAAEKDQHELLLTMMMTPQEELFKIFTQTFQ